MKIQSFVRRGMVPILAIATAWIATLSGTAMAHPAKCEERGRALEIKGYQMYTNVSFVDPANPLLLQVRTGGEGGLSHLGVMRSWSEDQTGNLATGEMLANYIFEDAKGDQLFLKAVGGSTLQPDGRIVFGGEYTVEGGSGRFRRAQGQLHFDGWARMTDFATGAGIGFTTVEGFLEGIPIEPDAPLAIEEKGVGTISPDGQDFVYEGGGKATKVGLFQDHAYSIPGPFHAAFVGFIDGRFVIASAYESQWTTRNGDKVVWSGVEFIGFEIMALPDGSLVPDFSKPSYPETFLSVVGGTGRFREARGIAMGDGVFNPTGPNVVAAHLTSTGFFSSNGGHNGKRK